MNDHKWIDTNIIVRAVTGHPPHMAASLPPILNQAANGQVNLIVPSVVVAECVYVLEGLGYSRGQVAFGLRAFFGLEGVTLEEQAVILTKTRPPQAPGFSSGDKAAKAFVLD
ncbi:type II toxin-antitoxin system VapC family toxin [Alicyclobacillus macrosporangiidus]|uniref:PIN domain-containing protein n=1 Tax=Alicyclobacillus macrosporangiidus TaxID=392015 RepID=A0A1I7GJL2_9BACL|nr:type II toxin-antitoxin system VapC family toxin [Alicyclobacillus macrosporangiidus]SFU48692.1 hypothetical protein SAMN05421543_102250 [Alicyclobacillus macrosporangiidus]